MSPINGSPDPILNLDANTNIKETDASQSSTQGPTVDILNSAQVVQFIPSFRGKEYDADMSRPVLQMMLDPEAGPTPFEPSWQKAANKFFKEQIKQHLTDKLKAEGNELSSPQMEARINTLLQAMIDGRTSTLEKGDQEILEKATSQTQKAWSLPPSWIFGTQNVKDWTPLVKTESITPPINMEVSRREVLAENIEKLCASMEAAGTKILNTLPENDPKRLAVSEFIKIITDAIRGLKEIVQLMEVQESQIADKMSAAKFEQIESRRKEIEDVQKKQEAARRAQKKQAKTAKIMKILGPTVAAVILAISIVAIPFTGGASIALVYAAVAVGSIMLAYTVADSEYNLTSQAMDAFNTLMDNTFPNDPVGKDICKAFILAIVIIALLVAVLASAGSAAAPAATTAATSGTAAATTAATTAAATTAAATAGATTAATTAGTASITTQQLAFLVAKEMAKQLTIQTSMMFIMSSNILPELVYNACIATGSVDKDDEKTKMIIQMIVMALTMILTIGLVSFAGARTAGDAAKNQVKSATTAADKTATAGSQALKKAAESTQEQLMRMLEEMKNAIPRYLKEASAGLKDIFSPENIKNQDWGRVAMQLQDVARLSELGVEAGGSIYIGVLGLQLSKILSQLGELEKAQEMTQLMIKLFEQLLDSFQKGISANSQWYNNLNGALDNIFGSASQQLTKATQQFTA